MQAGPSNPRTRLQQQMQEHPAMDWNIPSTQFEQHANEQRRRAEEEMISHELELFPSISSPSHSLSMEYGRKAPRRPSPDFGSLASLAARPPPHNAADYDSDIFENPVTRERMTELERHQIGNDSLGLTGMDHSVSSAGHHGSNITFGAGLLGKPGSSTRSMIEYDQSRDVHELLKRGGDISLMDGTPHVKKVVNIRNMEPTRDNSGTPRPLRAAFVSEKATKPFTKDIQPPSSAYAFHPRLAHGHEEDEARSVAASETSDAVHNGSSPSSVPGEKKSKLADALARGNGGSKFSPQRPRSPRHFPSGSPKISPPDFSRRRSDEPAPIPPAIHSSSEPQHPMNSCSPSYDRRNARARDLPSLQTRSSRSAVAFRAVPTSPSPLSGRSQTNAPQPSFAESSRFGRLAQGLQRDIVTEELEAATGSFELMSPPPHPPSGPIEAGRGSVMKAANAPGAFTGDSRKRTTSVQFSDPPTVRLPDVTGLTSAVATPARGIKDQSYAVAIHPLTNDVLALQKALKEAYTQLAEKQRQWERAERRYKDSVADFTMRRTEVEEQRRLQHDHSIELREEKERQACAGRKGKGRAEHRTLEDVALELERSEAKAKDLELQCRQLSLEKKELDAVVTSMRTRIRQTESQLELKTLESQKYEQELVISRATHDRLHVEIAQKVQEIGDIQAELHQVDDGYKRLDAICRQVNANAQAYAPRAQRERDEHARNLVKEREQRRRDAYLAPGEAEDRELARQNEVRQAIAVEAEDYPDDRLRVEETQRARYEPEVSRVTEEATEDLEPEDEESDEGDEATDEDDEEEEGETGHDLQHGVEVERADNERLPSLSAGSGSSHDTPLYPPEPHSPRFNESFHNTSAALSTPSPAQSKSYVEANLSDRQIPVDDRRSVRSDNSNHSSPRSAVRQFQPEPRLRGLPRVNTPPSPSPHRPPAPPPSKVDEAPISPLQIRSERAQRVFRAAPEHNSHTCKVCHRQERDRGQVSAVNPAWLSGVAAYAGPSRTEEGSEEERRRKTGPQMHSRRLPADVVLRGVLAELQGDFVHYKSVFVELSEQYALMDAVSNAIKRNILADHLRGVIDILEQKGDQIASLNEVLVIADKREGPGLTDPLGTRAR